MGFVDGFEPGGCCGLRAVGYDDVVMFWVGRGGSEKLEVGLFCDCLYKYR